MKNDLKAFIQYNCDNHITESAYEAIETSKKIPQIGNLEWMIKTAYNMQSNSANRKSEMKKLAESYEQKYVTPQNGLAIKFVTYNYEAALAFFADYEMTLTVTGRLKDDSSVKAKRRATFQQLYKKMRDMRNYMNLISLIAFLKIVADYQLWGQREKVSAFERKRARIHLKTQLDDLKDKKTAEKRVRDAFARIDLEEMMMKKSKIKMTHCPQSISEAITKVHNIQMKMAELFLAEKDERHQKEDHEVLNPLSDVFDIRNWSMRAFDISSKENEVDQAFDEYLLSVREKIEAGKAFYEDLNEDVEEELIDVMKMIYKHQKEDNSILSSARDKDHIIDQWTFLRHRIPYLDEKSQKVAFRVIKRAAAAPNAQTGCERANSDYNITKTKLSSSMKIPIIKARLRVKINGPPLSMFNPAPVRKLWLENGHQYAETVTKKKLVIDRIRVDDRKKYTSKIFN